MKYRQIVGFLLVISLAVVSCSKGRHEEFGRNLAKVFKSKKYKDFDTTAYNEVFKAEMKKLKP